MECRWSTGNEGRELRLVLSCRECGGPGPLLSPECMKRALEALSSEQGADSIVLSGHLETQIQTGGMAVLQRIVLLASDLHHLSQREPPSGSRDCMRCPFQPCSLFSSLRESLLSDPASLPDILKSALLRLRSFSPARGSACDRCAAETSGDLAFVTESYEALVRFMMKKGFQMAV
ncbi:MAG: hypothetical protein QW379_00210 [Thermoplasmata archaeon]